MLAPIGSDFVISSYANALNVQSPGVSQDLRTTFSATTAQFVEFSKELKRLMQRVPKAVCKLVKETTETRVTLVNESNGFVSYIHGDDNEQDDDLYHKCSSKPMDHFSNHFSSLGELHEKVNISINGISTLRCYCDDPNDAKRENKRRFREERGQGKKVKTTITLSGDVVPYIPYEEAVRKGFVEIENLPIWAKRWDSKRRLRSIKAPPVLDSPCFSRFMGVEVEAEQASELTIADTESAKCDLLCPPMAFPEENTL
nr:hypothetical protein Iba_chr13dCG6440 [Ipomoea batatas]